MRALVTGGGGFLGRYIVEQLRARGDAVRIFSRSSYPELAQLGVEVTQGDIREPQAVQAACRNIDTVFHVAALPGVWGPWNTYHEINTLGTENVIQGCQQQGVAKLVYTSSPSVVFDGQPHIDADETLPYPASYLCSYPKSKALAEQAIIAANRDRGLLTVSLRPHLIWGPRDNHLFPRLIARAKSGQLRRVGDGTNIISMSYVENCAHAHLLAADHLQPNSPVAGQVYFINEPQPVNLWNWVNEILLLAQLPPLQQHVTASAAWNIGALLETSYSLLRLNSEPPMTRFVAAQLSQSHTYSIAKAQRDFGFQPLVSVENGMRNVAEELRQLGLG